MTNQTFDKIAICGSGPSITKYVDYIEDNFENIICVSNTYNLFKKYIALVSCDAKWWDEYKPETDAEKFCLGSPKQYDLKKKQIFENESNAQNSGVFALKVARKFYNAKEIHMFGFDLTNKNGEHFFGKHLNIDNTPEKRYDIFMNQFRQEFFVCALQGIKIHTTAESRLSELL